MSDAWYLFDPDHPARAEQIMQRVSLADAMLVVERGTFANWEVVERERELMASALDARLAEAREQGLAIESDPFVVLDRLSARHPGLEAAIQELDDLDSAAGREALSIYADFLQAQGDARGELAMLQLDDPLTLAAIGWRNEHRVQLFGPLAEKNRKLPQLRWTGGWITEIAAFGSVSVPLASVLRLPACACLRTLEGTWQNVCDGLAGCRATVRRLGFEYGDPPPVLELGELPKLDELVMNLRQGFPSRVSVTSTRPPKLWMYAPHLSTLVEFLNRVEIGPLERFGFRIPWHPFNSPPKDLRALLEHPALHSLREISPIWDLSCDGPLSPGPLDGPLLDALLEAPLLHRLELRDLRQLKVSDPQRVADAFASAPGRTIVNHSTVTDFARLRG